MPVMVSYLNKQPGRIAKAAPVMVTLSMAVICLSPVDPAYAQLHVACEPMRFGQIAPCEGAAGKVTVTPAGAVNTAGCAVLLGAPAPAHCQIKGITSTTGSVALQFPTQYTRLTDGGQTMKISMFNIGTAAGGPIKHYLSASLTGATLDVPIGARLRVAPIQTTGSYSGSLILTVTVTP